MRGLIATSLADARLGLLILVLAALLSGCADTYRDGVTGTATSTCTSACAHQGPGIDDRFLEQRELWAEPVLFETDKAAIRANDKPVVARIAALFTTYPQSRVIVEGYADERGTRDYNLALGARRAAAYRAALIAAGAPPARIVDIVSYGKERPAVAGSTEAAWAQNRRAIVVLQE
jgi:peptidoglycan-associated lipoprotein